MKRRKDIYLLKDIYVYNCIHETKILQIIRNDIIINKRQKVGIVNINNLRIQ